MTGMKLKVTFFILVNVFLTEYCLAQTPNANILPKGFMALFDGSTLNGWKAANMDWWTVENGAITAEITNEKPCKENQYLFCEYGVMEDFELRLTHRLVSEHNVNGGFQFRSEHYEGDDCKGYQVDNNTKTDWLVRLYDEFGRHTLAYRGKKTVFDEDGNICTTNLKKTLTDPHFELGEWHEYRLICKGNKLTLYVNGVLIAKVIDKDLKNKDLSGLLALQLHSGKPMKVQFKNIWFKKI
jgi:hypothetical protein